MPIVTQQQLIDAAQDADTLELMVNGAANINGTGVIVTRLGQNLKTLAKIEDEINTVGTGWLALAQAWAESAGAPDPGDPTSKSAKSWSAIAGSYAAAAASAAAQGMYNNVVTLTSVDSPFVPPLLEEGTLYRLDMSGGAIIINLSPLATYNEDMKYAFVKVDSSGNSCTINRGGTNTINGGTSLSIGVQWEVHALFGDLQTGSWVDSVQSAVIPDGSISSVKLGVDITTAGKTLITAANASAQRTALGLGAVATLDVEAVRMMPQNNQNSTYSLVQSDCGKVLTRTAGGGATYTLTGDAAINNNTGVSFMNIMMTGNTALNGDTGVSILWMKPGEGYATGNRILGPGGVATAWKPWANTWILSGTGIS